MQNDMLTTALKIRLETAQYNRLFNKLLIALGKQGGDCKIEIHGMSTTEATKFEERILARYQLGLISKPRAIAKLERVSIEEAEEKAKEIEKDENLKSSNTD